MKSSKVSAIAQGLDQVARHFTVGPIHAARYQAPDFLHAQRAAARASVRTNVHSARGGGASREEFVHDPARTTSVSLAVEADGHTGALRYRNAISALQRAFLPYAGPLQIGASLVAAAAVSVLSWKPTANLF
jgi:hypothetical protein